MLGLIALVVGAVSLTILIVGSCVLMLDRMIQHYCDVAGDGSGSLRPDRRRA